MRRLGFKFACGQSLINQTYVSFAFCYKNIYFLCFWSSKLAQVKSCVLGRHLSGVEITVALFSNQFLLLMHKYYPNAVLFLQMK